MKNQMGVGLPRGLAIRVYCKLLLRQPIKTNYEKYTRPCEEALSFTPKTALAINITVKSEKEIRISTWHPGCSLKILV